MNFDYKRPIVFFDLETTGTSITTDKIISIAASKLHPDGTVETKEKFLNPNIPIPAEATAVHGIKDDDVYDCPLFSQVAKGLAAWLANCDLGGYNVLRFDIPLLAEEFGRCGILWPSPGYAVIDVYRIFAKKEKRDLAAAYKYYTGKDLEGAHDATADNNATLEIFKAQLDRYQDIGQDPDAVYDYCTDGIKTLDLAGKIGINEDGDYFYTFGKEKGKLVNTVPGFAKWMLTADFPDNTKIHLKRILNK